MIEDVVEFLNKLGLEYDGPPRHLEGDLLELRQALIREEAREYFIASEAGSLSEQFDALIDLAYVVLGTAYLQGFPFKQGWDAVHRANMMKVPGFSKRGLGFDARKPEGWVPPDIEGLLDAAEQAVTSGTEGTTADEYNKDSL